MSLSSSSETRRLSRELRDLGASPSVAANLIGLIRQREEAAATEQANLDLAQIEQLQTEVRDLREGKRLERPAARKDETGRLARAREALEAIVGANPERTRPRILMDRARQGLEESES